MTSNQIPQLRSSLRDRVPTSFFAQQDPRRPRTQNRRRSIPPHFHTQAQALANAHAYAQRLRLRTRDRTRLLRRRRRPRPPPAHSASLRSLFPANRASPVSRLCWRRAGRWTT